ncbi:hypothetical protein LSM04_007584 [Trypanosoma melophagium]|uniref:uncharacterized protein n=1 Tax=Trypanosoma melophagium TaxID=715481 RepID=UPI00351A7D70|nr:hypothetical protein LSM04_007584 [Trypanosoma melophagium]
MASGEEKEEPNNYPLQSVMKGGEVGKPPLSAPPFAQMREETLRKQVATHRLLKHVMHEEEKVRMKEACLERLLREKKEVEKRIEVSTSILPSNEDIASMKQRLERARQGKQRAANKVTDLEDFLTIANKVSKMRNYGDSKQRRYHIELKKSIRPLKTEVISLKKQLQRISKDGNNKDASKVTLCLPEHEKNSTECSRIDSTIEKLKEEKVICEERLRVASDALFKATKREAKVAHMLASLERQSMKMPYRFSTEDKPIQENKSSHFNVENDIDLFTPPLDAGTSIAVSVSRQPGTEISYKNPIESYDGHKYSFVENFEENTSRREKGISFLKRRERESRLNEYSEKKMLAQEVEQLALEYARRKRRIKKRQENLL